jgi:hypothetical protein
MSSRRRRRLDISRSARRTGWDDAALRASLIGLMHHGQNSNRASAIMRTVAFIRFKIEGR